MGYNPAKYEVQLGLDPEPKSITHKRLERLIKDNLCCSRDEARTMIKFARGNPGEWQALSYQDDGGRAGFPETTDKLLYRYVGTSESS